jgi:hypothetical protein
VTSQDDPTEDHLVELEELRQVLLQRLGMMSSVAKAYAECDIDMMRAMKKMTDDEEATSKHDVRLSASDMSRAVTFARGLYDLHDVSHLLSAAHVNVQNKVACEMERAIRTKTGTITDADCEDIAVVTGLGFSDVRRLPLLLSVIAAGTTNPEEIATIMDSMSDQSLTLAEGTL